MTGRTWAEKDDVKIGGRVEPCAHQRDKAIWRPRHGERQFASGGRGRDELRSIDQRRLSPKLRQLRMKCLADSMLVGWVAVAFQLAPVRDSKFHAPIAPVAG